MAEKTVLEAIKDGLAEELERDDSVVIMGEDVGNMGGAFRATEGFLDRFGERQIIDTPLAETSIVGIAIGMAVNGMRPIAEIQFADFMFPAYDQIVNEAAKFRYRSNGEFSVPMVMRTPYGAGIHGGLYHSQSIEVQLAHIPGLKVVAPSTPYDAKGLLKSSIRDPDPVMFLEHKRTYRLIKGEVPDEDYTLPIGQADIKREGSDITILTYGLMTPLLPGSRRGACPGRCQCGGHRPQVPSPTGQGDHPGIGEKDQQGPHRLRRQPHPRLRRRTLSHPRLRGL